LDVHPILDNPAIHKKARALAGWRSVHGITRASHRRLCRSSTGPG